MDTEWDLRFTLPLASWKRAVNKITRNLDSVDTEAEGVVFLMMSGVEFGKTGRDTENSYHLHCGVITTKPVSTTTVKQWFLGTETISKISTTCIASWSKKRDRSKPLRGWYLHHIKRKYKIEGKYGGELIFQVGDIPKEDKQDQATADKILSVCKEYAPEHLEREQQLIQAWNKDISIKKPKMAKTEEEKREAKKEYLKLYHSRPEIKQKEQERSISRKIKQHKELRLKFEESDKQSDEACALYCHLLVLEKLSYVQASMKEDKVEPIPVHTFE